MKGIKRVKIKHLVDSIFESTYTSAKMILSLVLGLIRVPTALQVQVFGFAFGFSRADDQPHVFSLMCVIECFSRFLPVERAQLSTPENLPPRPRYTSSPVRTERIRVFLCSLTVVRY
jgi:hypothetical protein